MRRPTLVLCHSAGICVNEHNRSQHQENTRKTGSKTLTERAFVLRGKHEFGLPAVDGRCGVQQIIEQRQPVRTASQKRAEKLASQSWPTPKAKCATSTAPVRTRHLLGRAAEQQLPGGAVEVDQGQRRGDRLGAEARAPAAAG